MSTLIAFTTKYGTTEKCAQLLADKLHSADVVNIANNPVDLTEYETVIIGSHIRFGKISKQMTKFISDHQDSLLHKQVALFICCGLQNQAEQHFNANFPQELLDHAVSKQCFGGELNPNTMKGFDRFITKMIMKSAAAESNPVPNLLEDNIKELAKSIH